MDIEITFHQLDRSDAISAYCEKKMTKLEKFSPRIQNIRVVLEVNKLQHIVQVVVHMPQKVTLKADATTDDIYASIDAVYDKLERQITDWKESH
ncbi:ribosome-associated translation inhibitor RaiA [Gammaproteobacteria bacterium]|nr:ribosome-associated translation inhibitor RaiA [Gammaproteobacteria bacterium]